MADLSGMFQNLGPTTAALMSGIQQGQQYNANEAELAAKQAQMDKLLLDTEQARQMNPMILQAKQQELASNKLKAQQEQDAYRDEILGKAIPVLQNTPGVNRHAVMDQFFAKAGMPLDQEDKAHLYSLSPEDLVKELKDKHEWALTQSKDYRKAMDVALANERSHKYSSDQSLAGVKYAADQRATTAAAKKQGTATIDEQVKSGKMTAEKGAVAYYGAAMVEADPVEKERLLQMAASYEQLAMNLKNAGAAGKIDVGAAADLPTQKITPALGTPPAATPAAGGHTLADVQKLYPSVGADQLRKAYKEKFGVDLK